MMQYPVVLRSLTGEAFNQAKLYFMFKGTDRFPRNIQDFRPRECACSIFSTSYQKANTHKLQQLVFLKQCRFLHLIKLGKKSEVSLSRGAVSGSQAEQSGLGSSFPQQLHHCDWLSTWWTACGLGKHLELYPITVQPVEGTAHGWVNWLDRTSCRQGGSKQLPEAC